MKAEFHTRLIVQQVAEHEWQLLADLVYYSAKLQRQFRVPKLFVTDFASVPRIPLAYLMAGGKASKEAVLHDWLYASKICTRAEADAVFEEAMAINGQPWLTRKAMWFAVRLFGWSVY